MNVHLYYLVTCPEESPDQASLRVFHGRIIPQLICCLVGRSRLCLVRIERLECLERLERIANV